MNLKKLFLRGLLFWFFLLCLQPSYSQIEYKFYAGGSGNYFTGKDMQIERLGVTYDFINKYVGFSGTVGYNLTRNISIIAKYCFIDELSSLLSSSDIISESPILDLSGHLINLGVIYRVFSHNKFSPYVYSNVNFSLIDISAFEWMRENIGGEYITTSTSRTFYESIYGFGYSFGAGVNLKLGTHWALFTQIGMNSDPISNQLSTELGLHYNFILKKH